VGVPLSVIEMFKGTADVRLRRKPAKSMANLIVSPLDGPMIALRDVLCYDQPACGTVKNPIIYI
jgi:hypothetical protein